MSEIIQIIGVGIFIVGGIAFLVAAFKTSLLWGLACLLITPITILYLFMHWGDAKKPFLIQLGGVAVIFVASHMQSLYAL